LQLRFPSVRRYYLERPILWEKRQQIVAHGDVLEDAIQVGQNGFIVYSIRLEFGLIEIESNDVEFSEEPI
jgi:hypothetical protein